MTLGLFLGRFQPFHKGHLDALIKSAKQVDRLVVGIGSSQEEGTLRNPFSAEERRKMIEAAAKDVANFEIILIPDIPEDDSRWIAYLEENYPKFDVIFTGNDYTKRLFEAEGYRVLDVEMIPGISATIVRQKMREGGDWESLVPAEVAEILNYIEGAERVKDIQEANR